LAVAAVLTLAVSLALVMEGELGDTPGSAAPYAAKVAPSRSASGQGADAHSDAGSGDDRSRADHEGAAKEKDAGSAPPHTKSLLRLPMQHSAPQSPPPAARSQMQEEHARADAAPASAPPPASASDISSPAAPAPYPREQRTEPAAEPGTTASAPLPDAGAQPGKPAESGSQTDSGKRRVYSTAPTAKQERLPIPDERSKQLAAPQSGAASIAPPAGAQHPARQQTERNEAQRDASMTPEQWLLEIEQLRRDGHEELARARLDQFRKRFPDHPLPESWQ
jgi:hypothetical protein